jgi:hypothetical protein
LWPEREDVLRPRTAYELAVLAALSGEAIEPLFEAAVGEGRAGAGVVSASTSTRDVASARSDLVAAVEAREGDTAPVAWFGFCGADDDPGEKPLWVTRAEQIGTCPWRAFVEEQLGVAPMPDPLLGIPSIDNLLVGRVVHGVLEAVVTEQVDRRRGDLARVAERRPVAVSWPDDGVLEALLSSWARRVTRRAGLASLGFESLLVARARRVLEKARDLEWGSGRLEGVLAAEVEGWAPVSGLSLPLAFRADRVDRDGENLVLVDYKSSKPAVTASTEPFRRRSILKNVARGRLLQSAAYSRAAGWSNGRGRYVYLKPGDWGDEIRELTIDGNDDELIEAFEAAVRIIAAARAAGVAFPRLAEADGSTADHCNICGVAEACRKDDSTFRRNLVHWMNRTDPTTRHPESVVSRALWQLDLELSENDG